MAAFLIPLAVLCPLVASIILFTCARHLSTRGVGVVACGGVGLSALCCVILAAWLLARPVTEVLHVDLWTWMRAGGFSAHIAFMLDRISLLMILVVTIVGGLIHIYAMSYMRTDPALARFFACMTLFVAAMLVLVLASDLLCLFIGWEGVGLCSYLLIGFWHDNPANTAAARKAFYLTRIGDVAFLCALLLLATATGSLRIASEVGAAESGQVSHMVVNAATLCMVVAAFAKSAQIPFQAWLPDAMAGPTPTSALIHAATMVTAGVYLLARLHGLFALAPAVQALVAVMGVLTLLMAACTALVQSDLKRILAWSTISQLGYMYLALGCGIWQGALFHLMTHAFFKALLFLAAGSIILRAGHEQDIFRMNGLGRAMPGVTAAFVAGASALAGLPLVGAGFYSKEMILSGLWPARFMLAGHDIPAGPVLWGLGLLGAFLTALYIFRAVFVVFEGDSRTDPTGRTPAGMGIPLACLAVMSVFGGMVEMPDTLAPIHLFTAFLGLSPPQAHEPAWLVLAGALAPLSGLLAAWVLWGRTPRIMREMPGQASIIPLAGSTPRATDALYGLVFVRPLRVLLWFVRHDVAAYCLGRTGRLTRLASDRLELARRGMIGLVAGRTVMLTREGSILLGRMQDGRVRWYAAWIAAGLCAALATMVLP
ncbi:NADH-quinone oxidoreductase subunit L [Acetobacter sp. TBRC 12305]|uniref:NADH-quinone oxidoreductase subunit L n=1 Tax=Acetobacter garciniae TaxID=2817435 RepID=A0A939KMW2_9PROT|nr:NADH-quinone oxidoreductase subunit L [Acetobacter garciniae]MBO1325733.1 NADH-quinone oxidoreductase subunit L [Acetobacter garciniae]MBX0345633.1 NADH-quinone oxidoreductase subunit L [Acetobacter garciniae]